MDFQSLYTRLSPRLKRLARSYDRRSRCIDADDLYQEMSIYLWNNYKHGVPGHINDAYIVNGCKMYILNYLRKNSVKVSIFSLEQ